jgi:protein-disulfide isomerase
MHDLLYEHQDELDNVDLRQYALKIGLEIYRFEADMSAERFARRVRDDFRSGIRSGVNGTPTFFINEERLDWDFEMTTLQRAVKLAIGAG